MTPIDAQLRPRRPRPRRLARVLCALLALSAMPAARAGSQDPSPASGAQARPEKEQATRGEAAVAKRSTGGSRTPGPAAGRIQGQSDRSRRVGDGSPADPKAAEATPKRLPAPTYRSLSQIRSLHGRLAKGAAGLDPEAGARVGLGAPTFTGADANADGRLSADEFVLAYHRALADAGRPIAPDLRAEATRLSALSRARRAPAPSARPTLGSRESASRGPTGLGQPAPHAARRQAAERTLIAPRAVVRSPSRAEQRAATRPVSKVERRPEPKSAQRPVPRSENKPRPRAQKDPEPTSNGGSRGPSPSSD